MESSEFKRMIWGSCIGNGKEIQKPRILSRREGLILKLKLQYFGHLMGRADSQEKTLMLGKIEGRRRRRWQRVRWLDGISNSVEMSLCELREIVKDREAWRAAVHGVTKSLTWLSDWTKNKWRRPHNFSVSKPLPKPKYLYQQKVGCFEHTHHVPPR